MNGSMKIKNNKNPATGINIMVAADECDQPLFKHCAGGHSTVSPGRFEKVVKPLLMAHGVKEIRIV